MLMIQAGGPIAPEIRQGAVGAKGELYKSIDGSDRNCVIFHDFEERMPEGLFPSSAPESEYVCKKISDSGPQTQPHHFIQVVAFDVPAQWRDDVEAWYNEEHIGLLLRADGWLRARRYHVVQRLSGRPFTSIAIHELRDLDVMNSPERARARATPWRSRFSSEPWFLDSGRWLYQRAGSISTDYEFSTTANQAMT